jgi:dipeptidyl aminopeptidase/acylaminoacyl peptidase
MRRHSPVSSLDRIDAPLLVIHGGNDVRVLLQDSVDVVESLRARGHPVQYLSFSDEGHSISKWRNRITTWRAIEDLLAGCLGGRSAGFDLYELMPSPGTVTRWP